MSESSIKLHTLLQWLISWCIQIYDPVVFLVAFVHVQNVDTETRILVHDTIIM